MFTPEFVSGVDGHPTLSLDKVKHLYLSDVRSASKLVQIAVVHNQEAWSTCSIVKTGQHRPRVGRHIVHLAGLGTIRPVPGANHDDIPIEPRRYAMGVSLVVHILERSKAHCRLVKHTRLAQVTLGVCHRSARHVDTAPNLNRLLVPQGQEIVVSNLDFGFGHPVEIEKEHIVLVEQMQSPLMHFDLDLSSASRHLYLVKVPVEGLESEHFFGVEVMEDVAHDVRLGQLLHCRFVRRIFGCTER